MRPEKLFSLFSDISSLKGIGPAAKKALGRLLHGDDNARSLIRDVVFHLPVSLIDRRISPKLRDAKDGDILTLVVTVETHQPPAHKRGKRPYKVICHTPEGYITLVFFHAKGDYITKQLPVGAKCAISGRYDKEYGVPQITHPDIIAPAEDLKKIQTLEPVYPLTYAMTNRMLRRIVLSALERLPVLAEWLDKRYLEQQGWKDWKSSLLALHNPESLEALSLLSPARCRLAYDELLAHQLALAVTRMRLRVSEGVAVPKEHHLRDVLRKALPYQLTRGQEAVIAEIDADLESGSKMVRLLQGDVGSGKTIVALAAMLRVVEAGKQAVLMVPTELLAKQHFASISKLCMGLKVNCTLLTGSLTGADHRDVSAQIASGEAQIIIGTQALFQEKVQFKDLGLAVIDEQHRFGVAQRLALTQKSSHTHLLVMTATPIPRTLAMTAFGDMDVSVLSEKPAGRRSIATTTVPLSRSEEVLEGIARALAKGEKVYWICPLVEEGEDENLKQDLAAAHARAIEFKARFGDVVGLMHGRMPAEERDQVMADFAGSRYRILVATTVVEVGVDVPDATIIIIEHAERFGLAQLHQLRGRVGRSDKTSICLLHYADRIGEVAKARLKIMKETNDGFRIAEEDRRLRGSGDVLGTRQSGMPDYHFANLEVHGELLKSAHQDARLILHHDPKLMSERGQALRVLLYLFGYDENIRFLGAG